MLLWLTAQESVDVIACCPKPWSFISFSCIIYTLFGDSTKSAHLAKLTKSEVKGGNTYSVVSRLVCFCPWTAFKLWVNQEERVILGYTLEIVQVCTLGQCSPSSFWGSTMTEPSFVCSVWSIKLQGLQYLLKGSEEQPTYGTAMHESYLFLFIKK